jgi:opacity protein-like surface antigen
MKKLLLLAVIVISSVCLNAQNFGIKAGVDFASARVDGFGSDSETGFFVGAFTSFNLSDKLLLQPELLYVNVKDLDFISLPLLLKFSVADKFNLLAGPSLTYFLDAEDEEFQLNLDFGVSYDVMENLDINAKYSYMLNKDWGVDGFFIGLGYKF